MRPRGRRRVEIDEDDPVTQAIRRLRAAGPIPPVKGFHVIDVVRLKVTGELTAAQRAQIAQAMDDVPYQIDQVPPFDGMTYLAENESQ
jgi:hypothetical protein